MPKSYKHIKQYEKEILELRAKGLTHREIGEKSGFKKEQTEEFSTDTIATNERLHQEYH